MNIEQLAVDGLIPYARNSRTHDDAQVAQIAASIREFGFTNPVLIDAQGSIIAGHGRVLAAIKLGLSDVPCIRLSHLTDTQKRAYVIADNKLAMNAGWDAEMLALEVKDLDAAEFNLELLGFTPDELAALTPEEIAPGLTDEDAVPDVQEEPVSKPGDVWLMGKHRVMCGDSTSIDAVEALMDGQKADMVFTDPPYGVDYKGIKNDDRSGLEDLLRSAFGNFLAASKSGASIYVFHSDRCADIFHKVFREFFHFSSMIIWAKNSLTLSQKLNLKMKLR
jgi:hypothetical protein